MIGCQAYPYQLLLVSKTNAPTKRKNRSGPSFSNALICQQVLRVCQVTGPTKRKSWEGKGMESRNTSAGEHENFGILKMDIYVEILINHCHHHNHKQKRGSTCERQHIR